MTSHPKSARAWRLSALGLAALAAGLFWTAATRQPLPTAEGLLAIADSEPSVTAVIPALSAFVNQDRHVSLTFEPVPATRLLRVRASAPAADQAVDAVAAVATQYIDRRQAGIRTALTGELEDVRLAQTTVHDAIERVQEELAGLRADVVITATSPKAAMRSALARARRAHLEELYRGVENAAAPDSNDLRVARSRRALDIAQDYEASQGRERAAEAQESAAREEAARVAARVEETSDLFAELAVLRRQSAELQQRERTLDAALQTVDSGARLAGPAAIVIPTRPVRSLAWLTAALAAAALVLSFGDRPSERVPSPYARFRLPGRRRRPVLRTSRAA